MSWKRFSFRIPGAFVCASSSISAISGARRISASASISSKLERPVPGAHARDDLEPLCQRRCLRPVVRLEIADHDIPALFPRLPALLEHAVRLADPRRHPEENSVTAAHSSPLPASSAERAHHAPKTLCTIRSMSLIPMNGRIMPPRP